MQEEKSHSSHLFSERTDRLAATLQLNLQDLPEKIGISRRMLFGYRSGTHSVSAKAWAKLERAEEEAGLVETSPNRYPDSTQPSRGDMVKENYPPSYPMKIEDRLEVLERQHAEMIRLLSDIRNHLPPDVPKDGKNPEGETTDEHG